MAKTVGSKPKKDPKHVTFVCYGNTCRSPIAEGLFRHRLKGLGRNDFSVSSAGISVSPLSSTSPHSVTVLNCLGIDYQKKPSVQIDEAIVAASDFVIVMTDTHKTVLLGMFPALYHPKIYTINEITGGKDIIDPFREDVASYLQIALKLDALMPKLIDFIVR